MAVNQADLEAIKQAIIGAINSAAGTAGTGATVGDPAEIARLEAYVQTLNRANAALDRQKQRAQSLSNATERQNELNRIRIERQQNLIEGYETDIALNNQRGLATHAVNDAIEQQIELAEIAIQKLEEDNQKREKSIELLKKQKEAMRSLSAGMEDLIAVYGQHHLVNVDAIAGMVSQIRQVGILKASQAALGGVLKGLVNTIIKLAFMTDESAKSFMAATGASRELADSITGDVRAMSFYGVQVDKVYEAHTKLREGMTEFSLLSRDNQREVANTGALLAKQGVSLDDYAKATQASVKAFGLSAKQAAAASRDLNSLAIEIGTTPQQMASDFAGATDSLSKLGSDGVRAFKDLAIVSKATGLEINKLIQVTSKFDTFEGAAEQAGKLNAALGGNFVNAMDLMMTTDPAERFGMIRDAILNTGLSFDEMSYYQRKFYAEAAGLDNVNDLALLMSGSLDQLSGATQMSSAQIEDLQERTKAFQNIGERFKSLLKKMIPVVDPLIKGFEALVKHLEENDEIIENLAKSLKSIMGIVAMLIPHIDKMVYGFLAFNGLKLLAVFKGLGASLLGLGKAAPIASKGMTGLIGPTLAFGAAILMAGTGIGAAASGFSHLAESFALLTSGQIEGLNEAIGGLLYTMLIFGVGLAVVAKAGTAAAPPMLAFGAAIALVGGGIYLAATGVGNMAEGLTTMFQSINSSNMGLFTVFMTDLITMTPFFATAALGLGAMALGISSVGRSLSTIPLETIKELSKLGGIDVNVATGGAKAQIEGIMDSINKINGVKLAAAAVVVAGATAAAGPAMSTPAAAPIVNQQAPKVDVAVYIDGEKVAKKAVVRVNDKLAEMLA